MRGSGNIDGVDMMRVQIRSGRMHSLNFIALNLSTASWGRGGGLDNLVQLE